MSRKGDRQLKVLAACDAALKANPLCQFMFNPFMFGDNVRCGLRAGHKDEHVRVEVVHATALGAIQQLMDGKEWSPDTLDDIAQILEQAGFQVRGIQ